MAHELLTEDEIAERLVSSGWEREGDQIVLNVKLRDFDDAIGFVNKVASVAESHNHHPDIFVHGYNQVKLSLYNHSAGGLTAVDFDMARLFDELL
jgi:4a-hydroxytetrahydrobiopterin dehydratase